MEESTDGHGLPEEKKWEELSRLSFKDSNNSKLFSLEDLLILAGNQKHLFLDIKTAKVQNSKFAAAIVTLIQKYGLQQSVVVESFNPFFLVSMRLTSREILLMYDFTTDTQARGEEVQAQFDSIPWLLKQPFFQKQVRRIVRPDILGPRWAMEQDVLTSLVKHGYPLITWTVDEPAAAERLFKLGIKGIQSNKPIELINSSTKTTVEVQDAGGSVSRSQEIVFPRSIADIQKAVKVARAQKSHITISGRRHSMGGQTLLDGSIHLNLMKIDQVDYNSQTKTVVVGAGASWKRVQDQLDKLGRSVKVMQSDNIFSVGGSIGVNAHGWQVGQAPLGSTVLKMKIVDANGEVRLVSRDADSNLFKAILGGYGQFGIIVETELETMVNSNLIFKAEFMQTENFAEVFQQRVSENPKIELAYGRLSLDHDALFEEAGLFWFENDGGVAASPAQPEGLVAIKRAVFRFSQYSNLGKITRWAAEKALANLSLQDAPLSRNSVMNSDVHVIWPLYGSNKDILHEYFIPKFKINDFLKSLKGAVLQHRMNLLNVTIREVRKDSDSALNYAREDVFAFVLLFSQGPGQKAEAEMQDFTSDVIDAALKVNGTFYLPYRLHYSRAQLLTAYPQVNHWLQLKHEFDPERVFSSQFFQNLERLNGVK